MAGTPHLVNGKKGVRIVSGIGFIGGGVIFREGLTIKGLNTAATLWCSAAVGVLCGSGFAKEAAVAALKEFPSSTPNMGWVSDEPSPVFKK